MKAFRERYTGGEAKRYERRRAWTGQWQAEEAALREFLAPLGHVRVLDIPCGTGRFWPLYQELGLDARGIDVSEDMLAQARARGWEDVHRGDIFAIGDPVLDMLAPMSDDAAHVTVCFRLLNWMTRDECVAALTELARVTRTAVVVSVGIGDGYRGRTKLHDWGIFADADLSVSATRQIQDWGYAVVAAEPCAR
jgi:SAM-dependent methyltransferase